MVGVAVFAYPGNVRVRVRVRVMARVRIRITDIVELELISSVVLARSGICR